MPPMPMAMSAYAQYGAAVPVAVPAFMLPIVTAGLWWACVGKWQGFIALLLLTAYLVLSGVKPADQFGFQIYKGDDQSSQGEMREPCKLAEGVCYTPIDSKIELDRALGDTGDWYTLCQNLGVSDEKLDELLYSNKQYAVKKRECLSAYFDLDRQKACWERVVEVVGTEPFENVRLADSLSRRYLGCDYVQRSCMKVS